MLLKIVARKKFFTFTPAGNNGQLQEVLLETKDPLSLNYTCFPLVNICCARDSFVRSSLEIVPTHWL